jgi:hypothetical protein
MYIILNLILLLVTETAVDGSPTTSITVLPLARQLQEQPTASSFLNGLVEFQGG